MGCRLAVPIAQFDHVGAARSGDRGHAGVTALARLDRGEPDFRVGNADGDQGQLRVRRATAGAFEGFLSDGYDCL